jgi:hypothetical protein
VLVRQGENVLQAPGRHSDFGRPGLKQCSNHVLSFAARLPNVEI